MTRDFQIAFDGLAANCSKDGLGASNLCLAEYIARLIRINELVSSLSWRLGILPMPSEAIEIQRQWQNMWWGHQDTPGVGHIVRTRLASRTKAGQLLGCQDFDFADSPCWREVENDFEGFRAATNKLMCVVSVDLRRYTLALYASLPSSDLTESLVARARSNLEDSYCARLLMHGPVLAKTL